MADIHKEQDSSSDGVYEAIKVEYRQMASWYDSFWHSYTLETLKKPLKLVIQLGGANATVLDVGCGTGEFLRRLKIASGDESGSKRRWVGVEPSKEMLDVAQKKFDSSLVELRMAPADRLPIEDSTADIVVSTNAFHFFPDKQRALGEIKRVLKENGKLIITDWCNDYWIVKFYHWLERVRWNWRYRDRYPAPLTKTELLQLVQTAGFGSIQNEKYRVRVFGVFFWGMQTIRAQKID